MMTKAKEAEKARQNTVEIKGTLSEPQIDVCRHEARVWKSVLSKLQPFKRTPFIGSASQAILRVFSTDWAALHLCLQAVLIRCERLITSQSG